VHGWLDLIRNDKLDGGRFERVLRIEPDHEVKDFILEITDAISEMQGKMRAGEWGWGCTGGVRREAW
jgi:hypothetical protein